MILVNTPTDPDSNQERAVSPVIGVILMVAITVILAAVIAAFVLDIGPGETDPGAAIQFDHDADDDELELELQSLDGGADAVVVVESDGNNIVPYEGDDESYERKALTVSGEEQFYDTSDIDGGSIQAISVSDTDNLNADDSDDAIQTIDDVESHAILENLD